MKRAALRSILFGIAAFIGMGASAPAAVIFDLNTVLGNGNFQSSPHNFGTVTISNISGGVNVTVDTILGRNFEGMLFNLVAGSYTFQQPAQLSVNNYFLIGGIEHGYAGAFDLGDNPWFNGFDGADGASFNILGTGFTENSFIAKDTGNQVNVALILNNIRCNSSGCVPYSGPLGIGDDITVGGVLRLPSSTSDVPEPGTMMLLSVALIGLGAARFRRA